MATEQRLYERVPFVRRGRLTVAKTRVCHEIMTHDLSRGGCSAFCPVGHEPGTLVEVEVDIEVGSTARLRGIVRHHTADVDGNRLGIEFDRPLSRDHGDDLWRHLDEILERRARLLL